MGNLIGEVDKARRPLRTDTVTALQERAHTLERRLATVEGWHPQPRMADPESAPALSHLDPARSTLEDAAARWYAAVLKAQNASQITERAPVQAGTPMIWPAGVTRTLLPSPPPSPPGTPGVTPASVDPIVNPAVFHLCQQQASMPTGPLVLAGVGTRPPPTTFIR